MNTSSIMKQYKTVGTQRRGRGRQPASINRDAVHRCEKSRLPLALSAALDREDPAAKGEALSKALGHYSIPSREP